MSRYPPNGGNSTELFAKWEIPTNNSNYLINMLSKFEIKNDDCEWKFLWIVATLLLTVSIIFNHSIYYIYIYFFHCALIAFYISRLTYATFDENGLTIYYGIPINRHKLFFDWSNVESIQCTTIPKKWRTSLKFNFNTGRSPEDDYVVQISLKNSITAIEQDRTYRTLNYYLKKKFSISPDRTKIYLNSATDRPFSEIAETGNMYLKEGKISSQINNKKKTVGGLTISDIVIFLMPVVLALIKLKR
ncbi:MAG: hypothetical protein PVJ84_19805 [Desulfobacteraceae bacterium]|jgi:hypothetical protein